MIGARWAAWSGRLAGLVDGKRSAAILVTLAVTFGCVLRLTSAQNAPFGLDLGTTYATAHGIAEGSSFPILGGASSLATRTPLPGYFYLVSPPLLVRNSPVLFSQWGALLCCLGLIPFALLLWERYGQRVAVFGSWLAATAPWLVVNGDSPWSPKVALPIVALLLYAIHRVCAHPRSRWALAVPLALAAQAHVYPNVNLTVAAVAAVALVVRPRVRWAWFAAGALIGLLTMAPSALYLATHGLGEIGARKNQSAVALRPGEALEAAYYAFTFGTPDISYEMKHARWERHRTWRSLKRLPRSLDRAFGGVSGAFVMAGLIVSLLAWALALRRAVRFAREGNRRWRECDPMALCLAAGVVATAGTVLLLRSWYMPRHGLALVWLSLLPLLWLVGVRHKAAPLLWIWLLVAIAGNLSVVRRYYDGAVAEHGVRTLVQVMRRVDREQRGARFELHYASPEPVFGAAALQTVIFSHPWQRRRRAEAAYWVFGRDEARKVRRLVRREKAPSWRLHRAFMVRLPGQVRAPAGARLPDGSPAPQS